MTELSVPALEDLMYVVDDPSGTPASNKLTLARLAGFLLHDTCQGRLTLESGVPVSTSDQTAKTNVYFTPYNGEHVALYDGTRWKLYAFTEITLALGTLTSGANYDVFLYDNAGTLTLELSAAWTSDTAIFSSGTYTVTRPTQDGIAVKSTNGTTIDATRRYLGTVRTTSTTTTEDSGASAAGTTPKRFVWNYYNRVRRTIRVIENADSWALVSPAGWRSANNDTTNRVEFVVGHIHSAVSLTLVTQILCNSDAGVVAMALDSTTTPTGLWNQGYGGASDVLAAASGKYDGYPGLGYHYVQWIEKAVVGTVTFYGDNAGEVQSGIMGSIEG